MFKRNIVANFLGKVIIFAITFAIMPIHSKLLGPESFGLVGFFISILALLSFTDFGITATFNREVAKLNVRENRAQEIHDLFRTYESLYACILCAVSVGIYLCSPYFAAHWLNATALDPNTITYSIALLGVACAVQLMSGLYNSGLMGLENQAKANQLQVYLSVYRGAGSIIILIYISSTIQAYFYWYIFTTIVHCLISRQIFLRSFSYKSSTRKVGIKWSCLRQNWRYSASMSAMAIISSILTQVDRFTISNQLPIELLGSYTLAVTLASIPLMLSSPIGLAVFPRFMAFYERKDRSGLINSYHLATRLTSILVIPTGLIICAFSYEILYLWTGSRENASLLASVTPLLVIGQIIQSLTLIPYYVALTNGNVSVNIKIGILSIFLFTPLSFFLISKHGLYGGGLAWLVLNLCTFPIYMHILHKRFLNGEIMKWVKDSIVMPIITSSFCIAALYWIVIKANEGLIIFISLAALWFATICMNILMHSDFRQIIIRNAKHFFRPV